MVRTELTTRQLVEIDRICDEFTSLDRADVSAIARHLKSAEPDIKLQLLEELLRCANEHGERSLQPSDLTEAFREEVIAERFLRLRRINRGGFGAVFEAFDLSLARRVALKTVRGDSVGSSLTQNEAYLRLVREAEILCAVKHPGVPPVYETCIDAKLQPFIAMELQDGELLNDYVRTKKLSRDERLTLFLEICRPFANAHGLRVVHCDAKPANIIVGPNGEPQVLDWGGALVLPDSPVSLSQTVNATPDQIIGTEPYISPEQAKGSISEISPSSDVYSLAVVLFEMLCNHPFPKESRCVAKEAFALLRIAGVDSGLAAIIQQSLAEDRSHRPANADELIKGIKDNITRRKRREKLQRTLLVVSCTASIFALLVWGILFFAQRANFVERESNFATRERLLRASNHLRQSELTLASELLQTDKRASALGSAHPLYQMHKGLIEQLAIATELEQIRFESMRWTNAGFDTESAIDRYETTFANAGLVFDGGMQSAELVKGRLVDIRSSIIAAIDHWALLCAIQSIRESDESLANRRDKLFSFSRLVDDSSEIRDRISAPGFWRSADGLREFVECVRTTDIGILSPSVFEIIVTALDQARKRGIDDANPETFLERVMERRPDDFWMYFIAGQHYLKRLDAGEPMETEESTAIANMAIRYFQGALALRPANTAVQTNLARLEAELGRHDSATRQLDAVLEQDEDHVVARRLKIILALEQQLRANLTYEERVRTYETALEQLSADIPAESSRQQHQAYQKENAAIRFALGNLHLDEMNLSAARKEFTRVLDVLPTHGQAHNNLAWVLVHRGCPDKASEHYTIAIDLLKNEPSDRANAYYGLAGIYAQKGQIQLAIAGYKRAIGLRPSFVAAHFRLGELLARANKLQEALDHFLKARNLEPGNQEFEMDEWIEQIEKRLSVESKSNQ